MEKIILRIANGITGFCIGFMFVSIYITHTNDWVYVTPVALLSLCTGLLMISKKD